MPVLTQILASALAAAQGNNPYPQQQDSSMTGIASGQTARLSALYPSAPAPFLQPICSVTLTIADDQGDALKSQEFQILGGKAVSLALNADTDLTASSGHALLHGLVLTPAVSSSGGYCRLLPSLDIVDNTTGKTVVHLEMRVTFPPIGGAASATVRNF
jgi:hypothetical protein